MQLKTCLFPVIPFIVLYLLKYNLCGLNNKCSITLFKKKKKNSHHFYNKTKNQIIFGFQREVERPQVRATRTMKRSIHCNYHSLN